VDEDEDAGEDKDEDEDARELMYILSNQVTMTSTRYAMQCISSGGAT